MDTYHFIAVDNKEMINDRLQFFFPQTTLHSIQTWLNEEKRFCIRQKAGISYEMGEQL